MIILITGASSGIGRHLALYYLDRGHQVAAVARRQEKLAELYQTPQAQNGTLKIYPADVTDKERMAAVITTVEQDLGSLDLVITSAGIAVQHLTINLDLEAIDRVIQTNVMGVFHTVVPAVNAMLPRQQGQIVILSSLAAFHALPRMSTYCASKAALNYQIADLAYNLKSHGIQITTICPGFIKSELTAKQLIPDYWCLAMDTAIPKIVKAIAQKRRLYCFPRWQYYLIYYLRFLPLPCQEFCLNLLQKLFPRPSLPHEIPLGLENADSISY